MLFNLAEKQRELTIALKELPEARYELARRDTQEAFAAAPSPSAMMHYVHFQEARRGVFKTPRQKSP
jgi:hypothetical protein